jgi:serine/threonine protein kinase
VGIAKSLAELHSTGICHGNLHPRNVLLSGDVHPEIRLSGLRPAGVRVSVDSFEARYVSPQSFSYSATAASNAAPVIIVASLSGKQADTITSISSPHDDDNVSDLKDIESSSSASSVSNIPLITVHTSKEADVYAFGILAWEMLSGDFPYADIPFKTLGLKLAQGTRPDLDKIPNDCPNDIVTMIANCLQSTNKRTSTAECLSTLQYHYGLKSKTCIFDVYISYDPNNSVCKFATKFIHRQLIKMGCEVCLNIKIKLESAAVKTRRMTELSRSKVLIVCINQSFQHDSTSMQELRDARKIVPPRPIIPVFIEDDYEDWISEELRILCQLDSASSVPFDIAGLLSDMRLERAAKARASKLFQSQKSSDKVLSSSSSVSESSRQSPVMFDEFDFEYDIDDYEEDDVSSSAAAVDKKKKTGHEEGLNEFDEDEDEVSPSEMFIDELYNQVRVFEFFQPGVRSALSSSSKSSKSKKIRNDD